MMAEREARVISDENTVTIIIRVTVIQAETNTQSGMSRDGAGADASLVRGKS